MPPERILLGEGAAWEEARKRTVAVLAWGGVAVLPAEGVYGYHVRADRPDALARLRALKPRESGRGLILLIAEPGELSRWASNPPARALDLIRSHWPGPLTLVLPAASTVPPDVCGPDGTVALRCPGSAFLRSVLSALGTALASTSANAPGGPPPASAEAAATGDTDLVVDAGPLSGQPSTVVRLEGDAVRILRAGAVRLETGSP